MRIKFSPSDVSKGCIAHVSNVDKGWMEKWVIGLFLATKECFSHLPTFQNELEEILSYFIATFQPYVDILVSSMWRKL